MLSAMHRRLAEEVSHVALMADSERPDGKSTSALQRLVQN